MPMYVREGIFVRLEVSIERFDTSCIQNEEAEQSARVTDEEHPIVASEENLEDCCLSSFFQGRSFFCPIHCIT